MCIYKSHIYIHTDTLRTDGDKRTRLPGKRVPAARRCAGPLALETFWGCNKWRKQPGFLILFLFLLLFYFSPPGSNFCWRQMRTLRISPSRVSSPFSLIFSCEGGISRGTDRLLRTVNVIAQSQEEPKLSPAATDSAPIKPAF